MGCTIWNPVQTQGDTIPNLLNLEFKSLDAKYENCLPDLRLDQTLLLASDYSGESSESPYLVFSFLITSSRVWREWEQKRLQVRQECFSDSRRMSFKRLGDTQRKNALLPLLDAANSLHGLSFSLALNKKCKSVFAESPPLDLNNPEFEMYRKWKPAVLDKAFLILHVLGLLLAGLAAPKQDVMWFTDEDCIAANDERVCELTHLFACVISQYLTFDLGHCRCGTSRCDNGSLQIEDLLSIPDIIAGAIAEQMQDRKINPIDGSKIFWIHRGDFSEKTRNITWWYSSSKQPLKRLLCVVDPSVDGKGHQTSWFHFHDQKS